MKKRMIILSFTVSITAGATVFFLSTFLWEVHLSALIPTVVFVFLFTVLFYQSNKSRKLAKELERHKYHLEDVLKERTVELKTEKERFRTIIEKATVPLVYVDSKGNFVYSNEKFVSTFGYTTNLVSTLDQWWRNAYPDEKYRQWVLNNWNEAVERSAKENIEIRSDEYNVSCADGTEKVMEIGGATIGNDFLAVFVDLTDRVKAEKAKDYALEEVKRSNKELEQFAYVASHDLQEPLRMVSSYTQLLAEKYRDSLDEKAHKYIRYAVDGAIRMQKLINDLLAYSRISTKGEKLSKIDLHSALGEALINLSKTIQESQAIITNDDLPFALGDKTQIIQLFQNLIANGVKFNKPNLSPHIHISSQTSKNTVQISVKDNGIGIDKKYHSQVFEIFQRLHTRSEYAGTGIGLALCQRIVLRHGGKIWVESTEGGGAVFNFTLKTP